MPSPKKSQEPPSFDDNLRRLEALVHEMEDGDLDLESAIERYKEGVALQKECAEVLRGYRKQVEELAADEEAPGTTTPYANDPDAGLLGDES